MAMGDSTFQSCGGEKDSVGQSGGVCQRLLPCGGWGPPGAQAGWGCVGLCGSGEGVCVCVCARARTCASL